MGLGGQDISDGGSGAIESGSGFSADASVRDIVFFDDFLVAGFKVDAALALESDPSSKFSTIANSGEWLVTFDVAPTIVIADNEPGGLLVITTGSNSNDFVSCQMNGEVWKVAAQKDIYFECRVKFDDANDTQWFIGLATTDVAGTTVGPILDGVTESIGFIQDGDADVDIDFVCEDNSTPTQTDTGINVVNDTYLILAFHVKSNDSVEFFVNGTSVGSSTTNIPDTDAVTLTMEVHSPTASSTIEVDYIYCAQIR